MVLAKATRLHLNALVVPKAHMVQMLDSHSLDSAQNVLLENLVSKRGKSAKNLHVTIRALLVVLAPLVDNLLKQMLALENVNQGGTEKK